MNGGFSSSTSQAGSVEPGGVRVLLVSAHSSESSVESTLAAAGFQLRGLRAPTDVVAVAQAWKPHAVVLDVPPEVLTALDPRLFSQAIHALHGCVAVLVVREHTPEALTFALNYDVDAIIERAHVVNELGQALALCNRPHPPHSFPTIAPVVERLVAGSPAMREVWRLVARTAILDSTVLVTGNTGVGKEVIARVLHRLSPRRGGPFVAVNCAALPDALLESELFGHERGSFTGASARHVGRFEVAHGGTLLLDEIGELSPPVQAKLLRVLQEHSFERIGGTQAVQVDVRVVAATNRDLAAEVQKGTFRADLLYRLNAFAIDVPPLCERKSDVLPLWESFVEAAAVESGRSVPPTTSLQAKGVLLAYDWPGNVRELQNIARRTVAMAGGSTIETTDLPSNLAGHPAAAEPAVRFVGRSMKEIERAAILATTDAAGNARDAAAILGISLRKFYYRLKQYRAEGWAGDIASEAPAEVAVPVTPVPARHCRILLAEDDDDVRAGLASLLRSEGHDVLDVSTGADALRHMGAALSTETGHSVDVLIADVRMPKLSGMRLLEGLRAMGSTVPVIVITAFADDDTRRQAERLGAAAVLCKPINVDRLVEELARVSPAAPS